jgi:hypothetical protein
MSETPLDNIFSIQDPDVYVCAIELYVLGHAEMRIRVYKLDEADRAIHINLDSVEYFSGPTHWKSARFRFGTTEEIMDLARGLYRLQALPEDMLLEIFKLYIVGNPPIVKIIASNSSIALDQT